MKAYNPHEIEPRWQRIWADTDQDAVREDGSKPKKYVLEILKRRIKEWSLCCNGFGRHASRAFPLYWVRAHDTRLTRMSA